MECRPGLRSVAWCWTLQHSAGYEMDGAASNGYLAGVVTVRPSGNTYTCPTNVGRPPARVV